MSTIQPEGEDLRKAIRWISEMREADPSAPLQGWLSQAATTFDLSPKDEVFLFNFFTSGKS